MINDPRQSDIYLYLFEFHHFLLLYIERNNILLYKKFYQIEDSMEVCKGIELKSI